MKTVGYIRVSTDKQADRGVSLDAQAEKIRAMAVVHSGELIDLIVAGGESAKSLNRPGMVRLLALVDSGAVKAVIVARLDRLADDGQHLDLGPGEQQALAERSGVCAATAWPCAGSPRP